METPWIRPKHHAIIIDKFGNSVPMYAEYTHLYAPSRIPSRALYTCSTCRYIFRGIADYCPDCGSRSVRRATLDEENWYEKTVKSSSISPKTFICPSCDGIFERNETMTDCPYCGAPLENVH